MTAPEDFLRLRDQAAVTPPPSIDTSRPRWIFGAGGCGRSLANAMQAQGITVAGFVETAPRTVVKGVHGERGPGLRACQCTPVQHSQVLHGRDTPYGQPLDLPTAVTPLMPEPLAQTLQGARQLIQRCRPVLAVSLSRPPRPLTAGAAFRAERGGLSLPHPAARIQLVRLRPVCRRHPKKTRISL